MNRLEKAVLFDWGDVLMFYTDFYESCAKYFGAPQHAIFRKALDNEMDNFYQGTPEEDIWQRVANTLGVEAPALPFWRREFQRVYRVNGEMFGLVRRLKGEGYKVGIVTNTQIPLMEFIEEQRGRLYGMFDAITYSCEPEVRQKKPGPRIFDVALSRLGAQAHETAFIDDIEQNVAAFRGMGGKGIAYDASKVTIEDLYRQIITSK